jgi:hypothetical protein
MKGSKETSLKTCMAKRVRNQQKGLENYRTNYRNDRKATESDRKHLKKTDNDRNDGKSDRRLKKPTG